MPRRWSRRAPAESRTCAIQRGRGEPPSPAGPGSVPLSVTQRVVRVLRPRALAARPQSCRYLTRSRGLGPACGRPRRAIVAVILRPF